MALALLLPIAAVTLVSGPAAATAAAACTTEAGYVACGRAFPDPQAGLGLDPHAEGRVPAGDFIQFGSPGTTGLSPLWDGLGLLESAYSRFLKVWTLEDLLDDPEARSAGLWLAGQRIRSPLILARVTDETVPARDKVRLVYGLSIHGIERAGAEGGTRALEDLVTYAHCESLGGLAAARADAVCANQAQVRKGHFEAGVGGFPARLTFVDGKSLTMGQALRRAEIYFAYLNPDGWHRGDRPTYGGVGHYQRYNGNGVDLNRDWPTRGYTYAPYTPASEPESDAFARALRARGGNWAGGIDLHGMGQAPVLTYTMLPAGQHDYRTDSRIRAVAERTHQDAVARLAWSPLIDEGDGPSTADIPFVGSIASMGAQQWGTVWDTIDYTVTGAFGDWIGSDVGLGGISMSNEMALSHLTNCGTGSCFIPEIEQLHVAGNKGLIYAHVDTTLRTAGKKYRFPLRGRAAYLDHGERIRAPGRDARKPSGRRQDPLSGAMPCLGMLSGGLVTAYTECTSASFEILGPGDGVANGGVRVEIGAATTHTANDEVGGSFALERLVMDHGEEDWVRVSRNYNAGQAYLPNGATVTHNDPVPGTYRIWASVRTPGVYTYDVRFTKSRAFGTRDRAVDASNLDFFDDLDRYLEPENRFRAVTPEAIARGALDRVDVLVATDVFLPGWDGLPKSKRTVSAREHDRYARTLRAWVKEGGTLVLTDGALAGLEAVAGDPGLRANLSDVYAGYTTFVRNNHPLAEGVNPPGAASGGGGRRQLYEPVPLGYSIEDGFTGRNAAPVWTISASRLLKAGGTRVGDVPAGVNLGQLPLGRGSIRFAGSLLPQPTTRYAHPYGLSSYALTYTGWQLFQNLVDGGGP